jgi:glutamate-1-semialdehyde aminotransferase
MGLIRSVQEYVTSDRQAEIESISKYLFEGCKRIIETYKVPAIIDYIGNKGCITFLNKEAIDANIVNIRNYQQYIHYVDLNLENLFVYFMINRGIWIQPRDEWSISFQHTTAHADEYMANFKLFAVSIQNNH